jgi:DNA-binding SARP family transcriptional activator
MLGYRLITLGGLVLLDENGQPVSSLGPRNLALLTYLALAAKPLSRDHVADLFWGDRDEDRARHSMREALSKVRQLLGPDSIPQRSSNVALSASVPLSVDASALIAASAAGDTRTVVALYAGPFLDGVHVGGARSFEDWSAAERSMYESRFIAACIPECARLRAAAAWTECAELARRWLAAAPLDPKPALELLHALAAPGTPDALRVATREYRQISERLAASYELAPHPSVVSAADEIAQRALTLQANKPPIVVAHPDGPAPTRASPVPSHEQSADAAADSPVTAPPDDAPSSRQRARRQRLKRMAVAAGVVGLVAVVLISRARSPHADTGTLAIVPFDVVGRAGDAWLAAATPRLLGAALTREHVVNVAEQASVRELLPAGDTGRAPSPTDALVAARKLGARWLLTGSVTVGGGRYWLDASLSDVRNGLRTHRMTISDSVLEGVISQATARLVSSIDVHDGGAQFAELEAHTVTAYRSYIRAIQLRGQLRPVEAARALDEAIAIDSGFVAAVMERRYVLGSVYTSAAIDSARALDHAYFEHRERATEFERLYFDAYLALHSGDNARAEALGRTLLARYPRDPRAYFRTLEILSLHGRFAEEVKVAERAIALDSAGRTAGGDACKICVGYRVVSEASNITGDLGRAESAARHATALTPEDPEAWAQLGAALAARGRSDDAIAAARRAGTLAPTDPEFAMDAVIRLLEARRYGAADSALRGWRSSNEPRFASNAADMRALLLRERGQYGAAARVLDDALRRYPADSSWLLLALGDTRARAGDLTGAERAFAAAVPPEPASNAGHGASNFPADWARTFTWPRALLADALWRSGNRDTVRLAALADSIQAVGARSYYARDWRLYHHVRGLIAMTGGRWAQAESELGMARWGRSGWTRTLVELAHAQLAQGRATDAVATLRDAYTAQLAAMGRYVPRSELDFEMARAFTASGAMDSARVYAAHVSIAWRAGDPRVRRQLTELRTSASSDAARPREMSWWHIAKCFQPSSSTSTERSSTPSS